MASWWEGIFKKPKDIKRRFEGKVSQKEIDKAQKEGWEKVKKDAINPFVKEVGKPFVEYWKKFGENVAKDVKGIPKKLFKKNVYEALVPEPSPEKKEKKLNVFELPDYKAGAEIDIPRELLAFVFENKDFMSLLRTKVNSATYDTLMTSYYAIKDEPGRLSKLRGEMKEYNDYYDRQGKDIGFSYLRNLSYGLNQSVAAYSMGQSLRTLTSQRVKQQKALNYKLNEYVKRIDRKQEALFQTFQSEKDQLFTDFKDSEGENVDAPLRPYQSLWNPKDNLARLKKKYSNVALKIAIKDKKLLSRTGALSEEQIKKLEGK